MRRPLRRLQHDRVAERERCRDRRADRISAAFHGAIAADDADRLAEPIASVPGLSDGMTWPSGE